MLERRAKAKTRVGPYLPGSYAIRGVADVFEIDERQTGESELRDGPGSHKPV
jgi:hypothetical protein